MADKSRNRFLKLIDYLVGLAISSSRRFPVSIALSVAAVVLGIIINHTDLTMEGALGRVVLVLLLGIPLCSTARLVCERYEITGIIQLFGMMVLVGLGAVYYLLMPERLDGAFRLRYGLFMAVFVISFTLLPYIGKKRHYSIYVLKLVQGFFTTYLYTAVIAAGLSAILGAIDFLLGIDVSSEIYGDVWMIAAGIFGLLLFYGKVPKKDAEFNADSYPVFFRVLFVNIIMLLLTLFTVVFYIYLVQSLLGLGVLKDLISRIILMYGFIGAFLYMAVMPLVEKSKWVRHYVFLYPFVFIMPLVMLFISLFKRVGQYSWTANRYLVLMAGIWLVFVLVYGIVSNFSKKPVLEQRIVSVMCILLLVSALGPQGAIAVSNRGQASRLEKTLDEYGMLGALPDRVIIPNKDLDKDKMENIRSMVGYLGEFRGLEKASILPRDFKLDDMEEVFGFDISYYYYYDTIERMPREYVSYYYDGDYFIDIRGYDAALTFDSGMGMEASRTIEAYDAVVTITPEGVDVELGGIKYPTVRFDELLADFEPEDSGRIETEMLIEKRYGFGRMMLALKNASGTVDGEEVRIEFINGSLYFDFK